MLPIRDTIPRQNPPIATWLLILTNSVVFLFELINDFAAGAGAVLSFVRNCAGQVYAPGLAPIDGLSRRVNDAYHIEGLPKTLIFDRDGKLAAQAMDMRTEEQFLAMLKEAGL